MRPRWDLETCRRSPAPLIRDSFIEDPGIARSHRRRGCPARPAQLSHFFPRAFRMDIVFIKDLRIETVIGIYDWERRIRQVVASTSRCISTTPAGASDRIEDTLDTRPFPNA